MKNKKICLIKQRLGSIGGLEKATLRIVEAFVKKGYQVTIVCSDAPSFSIHPLIVWHHLPCKLTLTPLRLLEFNRKVKKVLKKESFDIVFAMDRTTSQSHMRLGNGVHKEYLKTRIETDSLLKKILTPLNPLHRLVLWLEKKAFLSSNLKCIIANSSMVKNQVLSHYGVDPNKIHVIHNGVEWHEMQKDFDVWVEKKPKIAHSLGLNLNTYHLLFVGNGYRRKGLDVVLSALALLHEEDIHLSVIGKDKDQAKYEKSVYSLGIERKVTFHGQQKEMRKFYQLCDALILPSYYDPFANVTVEALAMGLFVITSAQNGGQEVIQEGCGTILSFIDPLHIAKGIMQGLKQPKTWLKSQKIRESVKHLDFSMQNVTLVETCLKNC